jgi:hypothetical protein
MYATKSIKGVLTIQRDGQKVLNVCDQDWEFANWLCAVLNELGRMPDLSATEYDREWLNAMEDDFGRKAQYA